MSHSMNYLVGLSASLWLVGAAYAQDVLMQHNDKSRTGANLSETVLNAKTVGPKFGKLWNLYADGQIVAQPLYVSGLRIDTAANPNIPLVQGTFNAVVITTMHNTIYVYDADQEKPGPDGRTVPLWATWLGPPRPGGKDIDMWSTNDPEWGILSTPVISDDRSTLFVVAWHDEGANGFQYRLHALDLKDGAQRHPAVAIGPSSRDASNPCRKQSTFNPCTHKQRAGLLLDRGVVYIGFGGDGNRGALFAFDAPNLVQRAFWSSTPAGRDGGIWQSGQAPAVDNQGNIYLMTGNGSFDADKQNFGNSFVKLQLEGDSFTVADHFTPCNVDALNSKDLDLGSAGPVLVPGEPARIVGGGKEGVLYVLSLANMGKFSSDAAAPDCRNPNIVQQVSAFPQVHGHWGNIHGSPVFWQGPDTAHIYAWGENSPLKAYDFSGGQLQNVDKPKQSGYRPPIGMPGGMLSLSADGAKAGTGVLWAVVPLDGDANQQRGVKGILLGLDAEDAARTLWTSEQTPSRDQLGLFAKFSPPTVAGGKVFVATYGDNEVRRIYAGNEQPTQFPKNYYVAVYGVRDDRSSDRVIVDQDRDDITLVRAETTPLALNKADCRALDIGSVDCTDVLSQAAQAPAFHRVIFAADKPIAGCALLRVTTAAKNSALDGTSGIGFWSTQAVAGNQAAENAGLFVRKDQLKAIGPVKLKNGASATLHAFAGVANCSLPGAGSISRRFKPFMEFDAADGKVFRNWDLAPNYEIGETVKIDRTGRCSPRRLPGEAAARLQSRATRRSHLVGRNSQRVGAKRRPIRLCVLRRAHRMNWRNTLRYAAPRTGACANLSRLWHVAEAGACDTLLENSGEGTMSAKFSRRRFLAAGTAAASMPSLLQRRASAQAAWPSRQIRMICSYPAGGQTDLLARAFGEFISRQVGQTVVIENKAGASGSIGAAEVARAEGDGHTILCSISTTYVMNRVMMKNPGYDMDKDLTLVSVIPGAGLLLIASPKAGVKTLDEFVAFARSSGKVNFGTYSAGSAPHMTINELNKQYGLSIEPIHYRGEAPMWTGLLEGTLDVAMGSYTAAQSVLQSNRGTVFAVHSKKVAAIPDVRTLPEQGATSKFFTISGFTGWALPKAVPQPIVDRLAELCVAANNDPKVKEVLSTFVLEPALGFKDSNALYRRELPVWIETGQALGLPPA